MEFNSEFKGLTTQLQRIASVCEVHLT